MADISAVMDELGGCLAGIADLRAFPYYVDKVTPPAAIVGWPDELSFDTGMARGSDEAVFPVIVVVGRADARSSRDRLAKYAAGSGPESVKAAIEAHTAAAWDSARVTKAEFGIASIAGTQYLSVTFDVDIALRGEE